MSHLRCVYINNRCRYQSVTQQYLKRCLIKDDSNYIFLLYLLACSITLYLVILHAIYIEFTSVIFALIIGYFYIVCMFVCIFSFLYLVISCLCPMVRLVVFQSLLIL